MIISSLCEYHDIMVRRGDVLQEGYSKLPMNYLVALTEDGKVDDIIFCGRTEEDKNGKKQRTVYPEMLLPSRTQKPGIDANIVEHRPLYLFGLEYVTEEVETENGTERRRFYKESDKARKSHLVCCKENDIFLEGLTSPVAKAYRNFLRCWKPEEERENPHLLEIAKEYNGSRFAFCLSGHPDRPLHEEPEVCEKWERRFAASREEGGEPVAQCPIQGELLPVARLHNKIKGVRGGQASGCSLVCFNNASEESYGREGEQSYNSGISKNAMEAYTEALNYLLEREEHSTRLGGMTIVHFALCKEEKPYLDHFNFAVLQQEEKVTSGDVDAAVKNTLTKVATGDVSQFDVPDAGIDYCIFGLVPNMSRIAIKFSYRNTFGTLQRNLERYHREFAIGRRQNAPPVWRICKELVSAKSKDVASNELEEKLLSAILNGTPIPQGILAAVVRRVRIDQDTDTNHFIRLNDIRAGLIKVCLNRKIQCEEEKITMALNLNNKNAAYLCGRLFAVLERVQQQAASGELNKTIKDSYFSSACTTPSVVFARLLQLAQNHLAKLEKGSEVYYNKMIGAIIDDLEEFPTTLSLEDQGKFILGYYQQNNAFYVKKEREEN